MFQNQDVNLYNIPENIVMIRGIYFPTFFIARASELDPSVSCLFDLRDSYSSPLSHKWRRWDRGYARYEAK